ncbi:hypothetical protein DASB73_019560 [Starmerella bacillaris]|uniref:Uncharacterized protein n=1 Tax=Starmerella bacillaris TaxID=1247836 RepID=A0AAV5RJV1_STABA|nr:hypothetical protein DASB73_019560 [Starmerella bacillaris]
MDDLATSAELLWPLLLAQIVYDEATKPPCDFDKVSKIYRNHPLLPTEAPVLESAEETRKVYASLVQDKNIHETDLKIESQKLAEAYYMAFNENLNAKLLEGSRKFEELYRQYEQASDVPKEERLGE